MTSGPNTGGMGAYSPVPWLEDTAGLVEHFCQPVIDELAQRGSPFIGCLFAGLMITPDGPKVLEYNARFGDPETQVLMPRIEGDLLAALSAAALGDLSGISLAASGDAAVTVVLAGPGLPRAKRLRRLRRSRASSRPRRPAHSSSTAALPRGTGASSRMEAESSP